MSPLNSPVLGLGLLFLGRQLVGQNLRQLSGGGFRNLVKSATHTPVLAGLLGLVEGALMQSATAVTFILVSMVGGGLIQTAPARLVVIWCNVGLTALAFLAAFNIHPLVAYLVGGAEIFMGSARAKPWNTVAGALLGVGMILFALGEMGAGAAPLKDAPWFRTGLEFSLSSPALAFACGIAAAAILQSNTGAAMLTMTLAAVGAMPLERAIPVIYGTNLGAIVLRVFLSAGMTGGPLRLVRMEDFFCIFSGTVMMGLYALETAGVPLVAAFARLFHGTGTQLAAVFLLSNLIPAILITPVLEPCARMIKRIWPGQSLRASLLTPQALADPATGMDLIPKELARLLASLRPDAPPSPSSDPENRTTASFQSDAASVENFCARLSSENSLTNLQSLVLQRLRAALHTIRHIGEAIGEFADSNASLPDAARLTVTPLAKTIQDSLNLAAKATASLAPQDIQSFYDGTKHHGSGIEAARNALNDSLPHFPPEVRMSMAALVDDFDIAIWLIHRLAKLEIRLSNPAPA